MRVIEIDFDDLDLDVIEFLEMSGKLRTREQLMRKFVLDVVDPVIALGDPFIFEQREDRDDYISPEVPGSDAQVDLAVAGRVAELDARACSIVLERDNSFDATFLVYKNTLGWLVFWSHRHPNERWRKRFAEQLEERKEGLEELKTKATVGSVGRVEIDSLRRSECLKEIDLIVSVKWSEGWQRKFPLPLKVEAEATSNRC
jgi:hypothetical protein